MCARFTRKATMQDMALLYRMNSPDFGPHFNVAPTQMIPAVRMEGTERQWAKLKWGLVPSWANDEKIGYKLINARSETAAEKPSFRSAFRARRCLIPADGFFEWKAIGKKKQPYLFRLQSEKLFSFAGLWEKWKKSESESFETCTILTTNANELVKPYHDRMPVILNPNDYDRWLDPKITDPKEVQPLLQPYPEMEMNFYTVNPLVNSPKNQGPECVEPYALPGDKAGSETGRP